MSFRPKVVDWACLLKKQEMVLEAQTRALNVPRYQFLQRVWLQNGMEPPKI